MNYILNKICCVKGNTKIFKKTLLFSRLYTGKGLMGAGAAAPGLEN
jgi:hypothetical protein